MDSLPIRRASRRLPAALAGLALGLWGCAMGPVRLAQVLDGSSVGGLDGLLVDDGDRDRARKAEREGRARGVLGDDHYLRVVPADDSDLEEVEWYGDEHLGTSLRVVVAKPRWPASAADDAARARLLGLQIGPFAGIFLAPASRGMDRATLFATSRPGLFVARRAGRLERVVRRSVTSLVDDADLFLSGLKVGWHAGPCRGDNHSVLRVLPAARVVELVRVLQAESPGAARAWAAEYGLEAVPEVAALLRSGRAQTGGALARSLAALRDGWARADLPGRAALLHQAMAARDDAAGAGAAETGAKEIEARRTELVAALAAQAREARGHKRLATAAVLAAIAGRLSGVEPPARTLLAARAAPDDGGWGLAHAALAEAALRVVPVPALPSAPAVGVDALWGKALEPLAAWRITPDPVAAVLGAVPEPARLTLRVQPGPLVDGLVLDERPMSHTVTYEVPVDVPNPEHDRWHSAHLAALLAENDAGEALRRERQAPVPRRTCSGSTGVQDTHDLNPEDRFAGTVTTYRQTSAGGCNDPAAEKAEKVAAKQEIWEQARARARELTAREPPRTVRRAEQRTWSYVCDTQRWSGDLERVLSLSAGDLRREVTQRAGHAGTEMLRRAADPAHGLAARDEFRTRAQMREHWERIMNEGVPKLLGYSSHPALVAEAIQRQAAGAGGSEVQRALEQVLLRRAFLDPTSPMPLPFDPLGPAAAPPAVAAQATQDDICPQGLSFLPGADFLADPASAAGDTGWGDSRCIAPTSDLHGLSYVCHSGTHEHCRKPLPRAKRTGQTR